MIKLSNKSTIFEYEKMASHTTFLIGGVARYYIEVGSEEDIVALSIFCRDNSLRMVIVGLGANMLLSSKDLDIVFVRLAYENIDINDNIISVSAGCSLPKVLSIVMKCGLTGLEFLAGIPSTIGGAIVGNVGSPKECIGQCVKSVIVLRNGNIVNVSIEKCGFVYRDSVFAHNGDIVLGVELALLKGDIELILQNMQDLIAKKILTQPMDMPSAGSIFKRLGDHIPALMIDKLGLKGEAVGGAMVSPKHSGFIVNTGNATSENVLELIEVLKSRIFEEYGIMFESEIKFYE